MKILLVDDDEKLSTSIKYGLEDKKYIVDQAYDGVTGEKLAMNRKYDLIILDVVMPGINGMELCRKIRAAGIKTPVIMLTSLGSIDDKVEGFVSGADDYLAKPFEFRELLARVEALIRRSKDMIINPLLRLADLEMDTLAKKVTRAHKEIILTSREYHILELLLRNQGRVLDRAEIAEKIWNFQFYPGTNVIDVHINSLRKKLDKDFSPRLIHTVTGVGYIMTDKK
jgi:two-component system copper resistance phosphate regulon response regulator CusR